jgi:hypothetical protein
VIGEQDALFRDPVDIGRTTRHGMGIGADIPHANVVAEDDQYIGSVGGKCRRHQPVAPKPIINTTAPARRANIPRLDCILIMLFFLSGFRLMQ